MARSAALILGVVLLHGGALGLARTEDEPESSADHAKNAILDYHSTAVKAQAACHIAVGDVFEVSDSEIAVRLQWNHLGGLPEKEIRISTAGRVKGQAYETVERGDRVFCFAFCEDIPSNLQFDVGYRSPRRILPIRHTRERVGEVGEILSLRQRTEMLENLHRGDSQVSITIPNSIALVTDAQRDFVRAATQLKQRFSRDKIKEMLGEPEVRHQDHWAYLLLEDSIDGGVYVGADLYFEPGRLKKVRLSSGHMSLQPAFNE